MHINTIDDSTDLEENLTEDGGQPIIEQNKHSALASKLEKEAVLGVFEKFNPSENRIDDLIIHSVLDENGMDVQFEDIDNEYLSQDLRQWLRLKVRSELSLKAGDKTVRTPFHSSSINGELLQRRDSDSEIT